MAAEASSAFKAALSAASAALDEDEEVNDPLNPLETDPLEPAEETDPTEADLLLTPARASATALAMEGWSAKTTLETTSWLLSREGVAGRTLRRPPWGAQEARLAAHKTEART